MRKLQYNKVQSGESLFPLAANPLQLWEHISGKKIQNRQLFSDSDLGNKSQPMHGAQYKASDVAIGGSSETKV